MTSHAPIARSQFVLAVLTLCAALVLGGGQGTLGDSAVQLLAVALFALVAIRQGSDPAARLPEAAWLAALPLLLPLLQLLPVPGGVWSWPEARTALGTELAAAGLEPALRWGLVPLATERALLWMLPAIALYLTGLQLSSKRRAVIAVVFVAVAVIGAVLGLAQIAAGSGSPLRFYELTNDTSAVGFFANRNHHAVFLAMALPFTLIGTAWWFNERAEEDASQWLWLAAGLGLVTVLVLGIAIANSRAGLILGMVGFALALLPALALRRRAGMRRAVVLGSAVALALVVQFALLGMLQHLRSNVLEDGRVRLVEVTTAAAQQYSPLGTGLGGFRPAFEAMDRSEPGDEYINHAHNDYAELWLEGGWPAALLALPLLGAFVWAGWSVWRRDPGLRAGQRALRQAAWIALLLVLLHSLVDYSLRTTAHLALLGCLAALLSRPYTQELKPAP